MTDRKMEDAVLGPIPQPPPLPAWLTQWAPGERYEWFTDPKSPHIARLRKKPR